MNDKEALQAAIHHYKSIAKEYRETNNEHKQYAVPIHEGLKRIMGRLEKSESQVKRFDDFVEYIKTGNKKPTRW